MAQFSDFSHVSLEDFPPPPFFYGTEVEDHQIHLKCFEDWLLTCFGWKICDDHKFLQYFPYSLQDDASSLFESLSPHCLLSWFSFQV